MSLYDALNPERAVLYLDMKSAYDDYISQSNLLVGDLADPTSWTIYNNAILTRQSGAYYGQDVLRVAFNGSNNPFAIQAICTIGKQYLATVWARSGGSGARPAMYHDGSIQALGTTSTDWQFLSLRFIATSATVRLWENTSSGYAEFALPTVYEYGRATSNSGKFTGAPSKIKLGDGFTSTRFPSQLQKKGMSLDGNDYISIDNAFLPYLGKNFTLAILDKASPTVTECGMIDKSSAGTGKNTPYALWKEPTSNNYVGGIGDGSTFFSAQGPNTPKASVNFSALTYDGSSLTVHSNKTSGTPVSCTASPLNNSSPLIIGAMSTKPVFAYTGSVLGVVIFPYSLSLEQLIELERRMRQNTRIS
jgi:hypothetical protein